MTSHELAKTLLVQPDMPVLGYRVSQGHVDDNDGGDDLDLDWVEFVQCGDPVNNTVLLHFA